MSIIMRLLDPIVRLSEILFGHWIRMDKLDEGDRRWIRATQIGAVVQLVPLTMTINVLNAIIVIALFWTKDANVFLVIWGTLIFFAAGASVIGWSKRHKRGANGASARGIKRFVTHAIFLGVIWGAVPLALFGGADLLHQLFLAALMAGMISGGAFGLSTVPAAGLAYTWITVAGSVAGLLASGQKSYVVVAFLLLIYTIFISRNLILHGNLFFDHLCSQLKLRKQGEVIGLLLRDFQEHTSDWLWETDESGALNHVSERFANALGKTIDEVEGARFVDIIGDHSPQRCEQFATLLHCMAVRSPFRDITVPVLVGTSRRLWSLSAKPVFDKGQKFTGHRGVGADVTDKRLAEERISYLARYDVVTGLQNRESFREEATRCLGECQQSGGSAALLFIDLDHFKSINDTLGHHVGDDLLKAVGHRITSCTRSRDIVCRLGGDEFAVLQLDAEQPAGANTLAQQLIAAFTSHFTVRNCDIDIEIVIDASVGMAIAAGEDLQTEALMKRADLALYAAKADHGGTYRSFELYMEASAYRRRALEVGLRLALDQGAFQLLFQPLVDLQSGRVVGCEALTRWNSPEWGIVSPAEFIPVAEVTGLIIPIGEWVLREAVTAARQWPRGMSVAVNLSPIQFRSPRLLATVVDALAKSGLQPKCLELEVTESIFLDGSDQTVKILRDLRTLGVRIVLDDFGTGYSSLSYLRRFPFDKIKIDKSFIDDVGMQRESTAIIRAILALAGELGMSTTAEGVESIAQMDVLRELGCAQIQGYVFSAARPARELSRLFEHGLERTKSSDRKRPRRRLPVPAAS
ncbi:MAG: EAL domain-containing protein [Beijerinckiaceae bacterium]|nr:EAL domain-containing protein [Beijerinckiaceae bacterium]